MDLRGGGSKEMLTSAGFNRRMRKTARPVVWKGCGVQLPAAPSNPSYESRCRAGRERGEHGRPDRERHWLGKLIDTRDPSFISES